MNNQYSLYIFATVSLFFSICIYANAQPYESRRKYSIDELKKYSWVYTILREGKEIRRWTLRFTDKEMISEHIYHLPNQDPKTHVYKSSYYLANSKASKFDASKVGKVKTGSYIIDAGEIIKKNPSQFISMEIIRLNDREISLYWCTPEGSIGGCDTVRWVNEQWLPSPYNP